MDLVSCYNFRLKPFLLISQQISQSVRELSMRLARLLYQIGQQAQMQQFLMQISFLYDREINYHQIRPNRLNNLEQIFKRSPISSLSMQKYSNKNAYVNIEQQNEKQQVLNIPSINSPINHPNQQRICYQFNSLNSQISLLQRNDEIHQSSQNDHGMQELNNSAASENVPEKMLLLNHILEINKMQQEFDQATISNQQNKCKGPVKKNITDYEKKCNEIIDQQEKQQNLIQKINQRAKDYKNENEQDLREFRQLKVLDDLIEQIDAQQNKQWKKIISSRRQRLDVKKMILNLENKETFLIDLPQKYKKILENYLANQPELLQSIQNDFNQIEINHHNFFERVEPQVKKRNKKQKIKQLK